MFVVDDIRESLRACLGWGVSTPGLTLKMR